MTTEYSTEKVTELIARSGYVDGLWGKDEIFNHMLALTCALASEHKRAESATKTGQRIYADALKVAAERDELRAVIESTEDWVTRHYLDTHMGEKVLAILSRIPEHDDKEERDE